MTWVIFVVLIASAVVESLEWNEREILTNHTLHKATDDPKKLWPHKLVNYRLDSTAEWYREDLEKAKLYWESNTCVWIIEDDSDDPHIVFTDKGTCESEIGMNYIHNKQEISVSKSCYEDIGTLVHLIAHSLGMEEDNEPETVEEYSAEEEPITKVVNYTTYSWEMTFEDGKLINKMYGCKNRCMFAPRCPRQGYVNHQCKCICPDDIEYKTCKDLFRLHEFVEDN